MKASVRDWLPELGIAMLGAFFFLRELGTFPAPWNDDSLFMIVARELAEGEGYGLPLLGALWPYGNVITTGPTVLLPVALAIRLAGFSMTVARIPMVFYLAVATIGGYAVALRVDGKGCARWTAMLLVTLSAFVNTGKPVLGEVPGIAFVMAGLFCLLQSRTRRNDLLAGLFFGAAILAKPAFILIFPSLALGWLIAIATKDRTASHSLILVSGIAAVVYVPWKALELMSDPNLSKTLAFLFGSGEQADVRMVSIRESPMLLLRMEFLYFGMLFVAGMLGFVRTWRTIDRRAWATALGLVLLFTLYFLSGFPWYRHVLPAHAILLPFAIVGIRRIAPRHCMTLGLLALTIAQGWWQFTYRGSGRSTIAADVAAMVEDRFAGQGLIVQQADVFVRLPRRPEWVFLTNPALSKRVPERYVTPDERQRCLPLVRAMDETEFASFGARAEKLLGKYTLVKPPEDC